MTMRKHYLTGTLILLGTLQTLTGQVQPGRQFPKTVEIYAVVTDTDDKAVINMAQDLFYTQLLALPGYTVIDSRGVSYSEDALASSGERNVILFYPEISQNDAGWDCVLHAKAPVLKTEVSLSNHYDTYYKVLIDAKASLQAVLKSLETQADSNPQPPEVAFRETPDAPGGLAPTLESLAGNWRGEPLVDKIIILRGGRGFMIFKNGASMNVSVQIDGAFVVITQTSKANASFFPEMNRETALFVAQADPPPLVWRFRMDSPTRMSGTKRTVQSQERALRFFDVNVAWTRE
jgi:hypothetical protein